MKRKSGILLPVFSLPGKYGIGGFTKEAYRFVDFLVKAGQSYWQILPIGPTSYGDSPYQSFSTFAGNPYFIDLDELKAQGLLTARELRELPEVAKEHAIDYEMLYHSRYELLKKAYMRRDPEDSEYRRFLDENEDWLKDYALFMAIKDANGGVSFTRWDEKLRKREPEALRDFEAEHPEEIGFYCFLQYHFFRQWYQLKQYANERGISIIGDIPIYVAADSADTWSRPELFQMDEEGHLTAVAGCPPDGFAAKGQLWGNPLYRWENHEKDHFSWWTERIRACSRLYDVIRIDHFRGFDQYYSIPATDETAERGHWEDGPGIRLFEALSENLGELDIIAEDLGYMTDSVRQLVRDTGFPNMKVLEFAFDGRDSSTAGVKEAENEYLPFNYHQNCVAYTGTHDNETLLGWLHSISPAEQHYVKEYLGLPQRTALGKLVDPLIRLVHSSVADLAIIPLQDYLGLDNRARTNRPSTIGTNWMWRVDKKDLNASLAKRIRALSGIYGRI
ncbi:MAG: 4-alpha-glucanotransferase [Lachnospiraceae bacterium]|nr:4-alpha-glucanotransferase [Lachnospiraceae bacterium]